MSGIEAPELNVKQPSESLRYAYEFSEALINGEILSSIDDLGSTLPGENALPLDFNQQQIAGTQVHVRISGGSHGYTYRTTCIVTTDQQNTYSLDARLKVDDGE